MIDEPADSLRREAIKRDANRQNEEHETGSQRR